MLYATLNTNIKSVWYYMNTLFYFHNQGKNLHNNNIIIIQELKIDLKGL